METEVISKSLWWFSSFQIELIFSF
jgi:hypothetical protein